MRRHLKDESVDLVYLDPPFNSNATYNVLFAEQDGSRAAAQIKAFGDTWRWDEGSSQAFADVMEQGGKVAETLLALKQLVGFSNMLAYLSMMAPRLVELRRVMKPTASIYLHCDPTASHYLKVLLDAVFGPQNFRSEVVWKRSSAHSDTKQGRKIHGHIHDVLLFYTKSAEWNWNPVYTPYDPHYVETFYRYVERDTRRRYRLGDLTAAKPGGDTLYSWKGVQPYKGRFWAYSRANMEEFERQGRLVYSKTGVPSYKRYLDEMPGVPLQDVWIDVDPVPPGEGERLGYPTQKPLALIERIIEASSRPGDTVLDPFCGCGTTVDAAQRLSRRWIGIDITHLAINLIRYRLQDAFGEGVKSAYKVIGEPTTGADAAQLAKEDPWQFQAWTLGLVGARQAGSARMGPDKGIDGRLYFTEGEKDIGQIVFSVKGGNLQPAFVDALVGVVQKSDAQIGALISFQNPTPGMRAIAASAGFYESRHWGKFPKIQLLTVEGLLSGKQRLRYPKTQGSNVTFQRGARVKERVVEEMELPLVGEVTKTATGRRSPRHGR